MSIKAIETEYNGYKFRSRLEARWAVFFDAANIRYEYEPEGFVLDDGTRYLPDFYLPDHDAYVEIKRSGLDDEALFEAETKCAWLNIMTGAAVLLCQGDPVDMNILAYFGVWEEALGFYENTYDSAVFVKGASWWRPSIYSSGKLHMETTSPDDRAVHIAVGELDYNSVDGLEQRSLIHRCLISECSYLEEERKAARKARFEYGATPKVRR